MRTRPISADDPRRELLSKVLETKQTSDPEEIERLLATRQWVAIEAAAANGNLLLMMAKIC